MSINKQSNNITTMPIYSIIAIIVCLISMIVSLAKDRYDKASFWAILIVINLLAPILDKLLYN